MKNFYLVILFLVFLLSYFLRVMYLPKNILTFGYDQARDALVTKEIIGGHIKIQGPPASIEGFHHGIFYNYVLVPSYLAGKGSPIITAYWIALINSSVVFIVFLISLKFTKKPSLALLASFLYAISFEATQYATWLSNPTIAIFTVPLMYLGLWGWTQEKSPKWKIWGPILAGLGLGLSIQAEIFLSYHLIPLLIWLGVAKASVTRKQIIIFLVFFLASISTILISEIKFGFTSIEGVKQLVTSQTNLAYAKSLGDYLLLYLNQIGRIFAFNSFPTNIGYGGTFIIVLAIFGIFKGDFVVKFLSTWLFSHITVVSIGGTSTPFLMVGVGPAVSIIVAYYLYKWWQSGYKVITVLVLGLLAYSNISTILKQNINGSTLFSIQKDMLLSKQLSLIDYTYQKTDGSEFSINSLTSPLWINIVWDYLYKWYGEPKYGYVPTWHGHSQVGQIDALKEITKPNKTSYLILEPMAGIPLEYLPLTTGEEDSKTKLIETKYFGELAVQKRQAK